MATKETNKASVSLIEGPKFRNYQEKTSHGKSSTKRACVKLSTVVLSLAAFVLSWIALGLDFRILPISTGSDVQKTNSSKSLVCVRCEKFQWSMSPEHRQLLKQIDIEEHPDGKICCARNSTQLGVLYNLVMNRTLRPPVLPPVVNPKNFSMSSASLHKKLVPSLNEIDLNYPFFHPDNEAFPLYFAKDEITPLLEHTRNLELMTTGMPIKESGAYLVYCSVTFKPDSAESCRTFKQKTWSFKVTRVRHNDDTFPGVILTATHTCCGDCVRNQKTKYTAGVFILRENDFLHVDVSGEGLISYKPQSTFFGITMLSSVD